MVAGCLVLIGHLESVGLQNVTFAVTMPAATDAMRLRSISGTSVLNSTPDTADLPWRFPHSVNGHLSDLGIEEGEICQICDDDWQIWLPKLH
ncbi:hypothetical protein ACVWY5_000264 [Bradyrhizobium sp. USDA 3256]